MTNENKIKCAWYNPCTYSKWETILDGENSRGWPVKIQEKKCINCGKVQIRKASCFS